ncbi:P-loop NTPase fold protein [Paraclostridium bifermentans]|uniref:P-loop NTPase fold protein n=1 Tax=Paraclostridium bifermentans TaxID=1490 RepID=UPI00241D805F|nr:P-loop NTPase fold protein [Paraclostridium bifermentans]
MNSLIIILNLLACFIITCSIVFFVYLKKEQKINNSINMIDFKQLLTSIIIAIAIGVIIQKINQNIMIEALTLYYNNIAYLFGSISILLLIEIVFYSNSKIKVLSKYAYIFTYIIYSLMLTLVSINKLDINQILCSGLWLFLFYICQVFEDTSYKLDDKFNERSEDPINDRTRLYRQRLTELKHIEKYIQDNSKNNNCTISICADWGEGKTSFINALKEGREDSKEYVIFIQPMIMDSRKSLIDYFFSQMKIIMEKKSIYTGKGSSIDKYVNSLMNIIGKDSKKIFDSLFDIDKLHKNDYREQKENLQKDIDILLNLNSSNNKSIKILIDDFDRVEESVMYQILAFIKEVASFRGCTVIFLMDYKKIRNNTITYEYLDKFISKKFELKKIHKEEIIKYYLDNKIYFNYENEDNEIIKKQYIYFSKNIYKELNNVEECIKKDKERINNIVEELKKDYENSDNELSKENNEEIKKKEEELDTVKSYMKIYTDLSSNPRRIKKLFTEVEYVCKLIYERYYDNSIEDILANYDLVNCNEIILRMSLLKIFFEKEHDDLLYILDIEEYIRARGYTNIVRILFEKKVKKYFDEIEDKRQNYIYNFINENFIRSHSSLESVVEIKTRNKEILQVLDEGNLIKTDESYGILDVLHAIYSDTKSNDNEIIIGDRLIRLENYIEYLIDSDKMRFIDVLKEIMEHNGRLYYNKCVKRVGQLLKYLIFKLLEKEYTFNDIKEKQYIITLCEKFQANIVFKNKASILSTLRMVLSKDEIIKFNLQNKDIYDEENLKIINEYATSLLEIENDTNVSNEIEMLEKWINECINRFNSNQNIDQIYKKRICYIHKDALDFVKSVKLIYELRQMIEKVNIIYKYDIEYRDIPYKLVDLQDEVILLKEQLEVNEKFINIKEIYILFDRITAQIYNTSLDCNEYVNKECLENIDYIYDVLDKKYNDEYLDVKMWSYCALRITYIKVFSV